ncbi:hypothetical protein QFZ43_008663 [Streptomyces afghaniensis]|nr:hypothetical protein [Streptomyces afghaniensis]
MIRSRSIASTRRLERLGARLTSPGPGSLAAIGSSGADRVLTWAPHMVRQSRNVWHLAPTGYASAGPDAEECPDFSVRRFRRAVLRLRVATVAGRDVVAAATSRRLRLWDTAQTVSPLLSILVVVVMTASGSTALRPGGIAGADPAVR